MSVEPAWLACRYDADRAARSTGVRDRVAACFSGRSDMRIVDLGAGTGANLAHCTGLFAGDQHWTLIEQDPGLLDAVEASLDCWLGVLGWTARAGEQLADGLRFTKNGRSLRVTLVPATVECLAERVDLAATDLVTANALFDLFSEIQFHDVITLLRRFRVPCYATLNYASMRFTPSDRLSEHYVDLYEAHMRRPRPAGRSMGARCTHEMAAVATRIGARVERAPSPWILGPGKAPMLRYLVRFMREAIPEVLPCPTDLPQLLAWEKERMALIERRGLSLDVSHEDILIS